MKKLIIVGAGGFGRSIFEVATNSIGYNSEFEIKGFLDYPVENWNSEIYPPILGVETEYEFQQNDVFVCAIGVVQRRKQIIEYIINKGGDFINLIHNTATIALDSIMGNGNIIMRDVNIGSCAKIGNYNLIQNRAIISHDAKIGSYVRIDVNVICVGGVIVNDEATLHTSSVISHGVTIGEKAKVGALSLVIRNVKDGVTVVGNPARKL